MQKTVVGVFLWLITTSLLLSCKDEEVNKPVEKLSQAVFVVNEGNFNWNNGSLSRFDVQTRNVDKDCFKSANGRDLGDVPQSMTVVDTLGFVVINNSARIEVIDVRTCKHVATIEGLVSPRYLLPVNTTTAYISNLYGSTMQVVDLKKFAVISSINVGTPTEQMILSDNKVFAAHWANGKTVWVIDTRTNQVTDSIKTTLEPNSMIIDKHKRLWILSSGGFTHTETPTLQVVNTQSLQTEKTFTFPSTQHYPTELVCNNTADTLYFINNDVFSMSVNDTTLPTQAFIKADNRTFYAMYVQPHNGEIWLSDAIDYVQQGVVFCYNNKGSLVSTFRAGINPGAFGFYNN